MWTCQLKNNETILWRSLRAAFYLLLRHTIFWRLRKKVPTLKKSWDINISACSAFIQYYSITAILKWHIFVPLACRWTVLYTVIRSLEKGKTPRERPLWFPARFQYVLWEPQYGNYISIRAYLQRGRKYFYVRVMNSMPIVQCAAKN